MLLLAACTESGPPPDMVAAICLADSTPITEIQGDGYHSQLVDSLRTVRGTVTFVVPGTGFYIEDSEPNADRQSSKALYISDADLARTVHPGQQLAISGVIAELGTRLDKLTTLVDISGHEICGMEIELPLTQVQLPLTDREREALEGMRVIFEQMLTLTDVYNLSRGELTLSSNGVLRTPTEVVPPGSQAKTLEKENRDSSISAALPGSPYAMAVGSTTRYAAGLMGHNGRGQQLILDSAPEMTVTSPPPLTPAGKTSVRVVTSNLLNFFNGDGTGTGFPTERGAETLKAFQAQSARIQAAMAVIQPDLLAVQELENDGFGADSAAQSLLDLLNSAGHDDWAFINPGPGSIGGDVITVGLFYRQRILEAIGPPVILDQPEFRHLSRQPIAQVFRAIASGTAFLVAVNHLKSKGSCPESGDNADRGDGQGCWNAARLAAVKAEVPWLKRLANDAGTQNILVLGDMNALRNEDPVRQFIRSGFVDLIEADADFPQYSFLYRGQAGTLDYTFATPPLAAHAKQTAIWHINADWPADMELPQPWLRSSDHDPVIVDFDFSQSATSN